MTEFDLHPEGLTVAYVGSMPMYARLNPVAMGGLPPSSSSLFANLSFVRLPSALSVECAPPPAPPDFAKVFSAAAAAGGFDRASRRLC